MKKISKSVIAIALSLSTAFGLAACGGQKTPGASTDPKTLNVRVRKGGYGEEWVRDLAANFERVYKAEGYKVNLVNPSTDMKGNVALLEMAQGTNETNMDLYITADITPEQLGVNGDYGIIAEDVSEMVFNQKPIKYDGTEEDTLVRDKLEDALLPYTADSTGVQYMVPYINTAAGFVVNTKKLAAYGLELPKTTNELFDCFQKIYLGTNGIANSEKSKTFPLTYFAGTSHGYTTPFLFATMAQYDYEEFTQFMSLEKTDADGNVVAMSEDGYEILNSQSVQEMLTIGYSFFDASIPSYGTTTQVLDQAQAQIMRDGGAVFMGNGDWFLNEVRYNYANSVQNITFINFPVVSALGKKVFGAGTTYNFDDAKCEEMLRYIIDLVDEAKTVEEIVAAVASVKGVTITADDALVIAKARGVYYNRGMEHQACIVKDSPKKDIAALFLRMMASEDCAKSITKYANATSAYTSTMNAEAKYEFTRAASKILVNPYANMIRNEVKGYRKSKTLNAGLFNLSSLASTLEQAESTIYDGNGALLAGKSMETYRQLAIAYQATAYETAKTSWATWTK